MTEYREPKLIPLIQGAYRTRKTGMSKEELQIFTDYYQHLHQKNEDEMEYTRIILRSIRVNLGEQLYKDLHQLIGHCDVDGTGFKFCKKPHGQWEDYKTESFDGYYVDQMAVGDSGDSWEGNIYVKLKKSLYLKMPFSS